MKATLVALIASLPLAAGAGTPFSDGTALTSDRGRLEVGVFSPLRWAVRDRLEVSLHPVAFFVVPNVDVKIGWGEPRGVALASVHGLSYPTPLMRLLSREGTGGILPADVTFPHVVSTSQHLVASIPIRSHLLTGRLGGRLAWNVTEFDGPRFWSEVEWHFVWPRAAAWYTGWSLDGGLSAQGPVAGRFRYRADVDLFLMPGLDGDRAVEWRLLLEWRPSRRFRLAGGAAFSWAVFPYGDRMLWPPFPMLDATWGWDLGPR